MADTTTLYVNNTAGANCSDTGPGTRTQPYCTIAAAISAVAPGQTIDITGTYTERVTVGKSGTPGAPIALTHSGTDPATIAGLTIDGQHDISVTGLRILTPQGTHAGVSLSNASAITLQQITVAGTATGPTVAFELTGVSASSLGHVRSTGSAVVTGLAMDSATTGVVVQSALFHLGITGTSHTVVDVAGSGNTFVDNDFVGGTAGLVLEPGAADNIVANNLVEFSQGIGIDNPGGTGTAITNNTVQDNCGTGIRVAGASSGVSVQNNRVVGNGPASATSCPAATPLDSVEIGLYDNALGHTVVDYNNVFYFSGPGSSGVYAWNHPATLQEFRSLSGQAAHDLETASTSDNVDSANSAAPGYQSTDKNGRPREDNPNVPDTGAGPVTYADRGDFEVIPGPQVKLAVTVDHANLTVTADASASTPGWVPLVTFAFNFGDGTVVSQGTPVATHKYAQPGTYTISVTVTDTASISTSTSQQQTVWPATRTVGWLAHGSLHYVSTASCCGADIGADSGVLGAAQQFDLVDLNNGFVALRHRGDAQYVSVLLFNNNPLNASHSTVVTDTEMFSVSTNADGSISLKSKANGKYVSDNDGNGSLVADRSAIGPWEEFYFVDPAKANLSLHAHANAKFVTAESAGTQPLIANRTAVGAWERFDVVDLGNGSVALFSHADLRFVTAESAGTQPLIANRTSTGAWETFKLVKNADGSVALLAGANGRYVTAESAGTQPLIANRSAIGSWEEFDLA
jgi:putative intracellular protease/amidase